MRDSFALGRGSLLIRTPSARQQVSNRRLTVACGVLALALASGLAGSLMHPAHAPPSAPATGPFSYIPSE